MTHDIDETAAIKASLALAASRYPGIASKDVVALADAAGLGKGAARTRLLMAHLQVGAEADAVRLGAEAVQGQRDLKLFCRELVNHAPTTVRTLTALAQVLLDGAPHHPLAKMTTGDPLWVAPAFDAARVDDRFVVKAPLSAGFPETFEGVLLGMDNPLEVWALCAVVERHGDMVTLQLEADNTLVSDKYNVAPPAILVSSASTRQLPALAGLKAKLRRGLRQLAND